MLRRRAKISTIACTFILITSIIINNIFAGTPSKILGIENETGTAVTDNTINIGGDKLGDYGIETAKKGLESSPASSGYSKLGTASKFLKYGLFVVGIYDTAKDSIDYLSYKSKHKSMHEKLIDNGLYILGTGMSIVGIVGTTIAIFNPATAAAGGAVAVVSGTGYALTTAGVSISRAVYNSETLANITDFMKGKKTLVFAPLTRPDVKEGLDIIKDELGFDLYPGLKREIPDPNTGIPVYKPNIYLYSNTDTIYNVRLYPDNYITLSIPKYNPEKGWDADVFNGSLNGKEDYLFYEALVPDEGFNLKEGFIVHQRNLENDMIEILDKYKFNDKEKKDFVDYWYDKLKGDRDYVFYPQYNKTLDKIMPLIVSPSPDSIYRLWFYIVPYNNEHIKSPEKITPIERYNSTVVEWGGLMK